MGVNLAPPCLFTTTPTSPAGPSLPPTSRSREEGTARARGPTPHTGHLEAAAWATHTLQPPRSAVPFWGE